MHVTLRARGGLPPFREKVIFLRMREAIRAASGVVALGASFRVIAFSVQNDHVHLIVEASDGDRLRRGVQGLVIRLARAINDVLETRGRVWGDRYHARELRSPREVRAALVYVLMNAKKHLGGRAQAVDTRSSAPWFAGFRDGQPLLAELREAMAVPSPVVMARTWLGAIGWRRSGLICIHEAPA